MITHLSLYPNDGPPVYITIKYVPELDQETTEGFWDIDTNNVALNWRLYSDFSKIESQKEKKKFFDNLLKVSKYSIK